jgi:hypothetical protein
MSKQLDRKYLRINNRQEVTTGFVYTPDKGYKSVAEPSIVTWTDSGRGVQGESVNAKTGSGKQQLLKNRKAI